MDGDDELLRGNTDRLVSGNKFACPCLCLGAFVTLAACNAIGYWFIYASEVTDPATWGPKGILNLTTNITVTLPPRPPNTSSSGSSTKTMTWSHWYAWTAVAIFVIGNLTALVYMMKALLTCNEHYNKKQLYAMQGRRMAAERENEEEPGYVKFMECISSCADYLVSVVQCGLCCWFCFGLVLFIFGSAYSEGGGRDRKNIYFVQATCVWLLAQCCVMCCVAPVLVASVGQAVGMHPKDPEDGLD